MPALGAVCWIAVPSYPIHIVLSQRKCCSAGEANTAQPHDLPEGAMTSIAVEHGPVALSTRGAMTA